MGVGGWKYNGKTILASLMSAEFVKHRKEILMEKDEALELLLSGKIAIWNQYRKSNPDWAPDLSGTVFVGNLFEANLANADLCGCDFSKAIMFNMATWANSGSRTELTGAKYDAKTQFPQNCDPAQAGAIYVNKAAHRYMDKIRLEVFISYAWANDDVVLAIDSWLRKKGLRTKLDKRDFFAGARIRDEIMRVMYNCDSILIFYSKQSAEKPWPEFERKLANDLQKSAKKIGHQPPRSIYVVMGDIALPSISEENKIAVFTKGKRFELVCEEIYHSILELPQKPTDIDLDKWSDFVF